MDPNMVKKVIEKKPMSLKIVEVIHSFLTFNEICWNMSPPVEITLRVISTGGVEITLTQVQPHMQK